MAFLRVENLTHTYNEKTAYAKDAVSGVSFSAEKGEIIGIIGHTGSGKSTLIEHLNGLLKPNDGQIFIDDVDIWQNPKDIKKYRFRVGLVFQYPEYQLFDETVYDDIAFGPKNMGLNAEEIDIRVKETIKRVGLDESYLEKSPFDLSGGEKRRVAIAGVLAMNPEIIVFDEPTAGLDPSGRQMVIDIIKNYRDTYNAAVIIVSHSMEDMAVLADKILVMNSGKVAMFDTPQNVFSRNKELQKIGLSVPAVTKVCEILREKGINLPKSIITVSDAVQHLLKLKQGGGTVD
ncbi:MAG: energy-coupling factor transporter ATPase [Acutalibacteraceae bacterium]|nr:energy-coupling factor transporter ATPase [Acutalibacteraceae bacterium]